MYRHPLGQSATFNPVQHGHALNVIKHHREVSCDLKMSSLDKMAAKMGTTPVNTGSFFRDALL